MGHIRDEVRIRWIRCGQLSLAGFPFTLNKKGKTSNKSKRTRAPNHLFQKHLRNGVAPSTCWCSVHVGLNPVSLRETRRQLVFVRGHSNSGLPSDPLAQSLTFGGLNSEATTKNTRRIQKAKLNRRAGSQEFSFTLSHQLPAAPRLSFLPRRMAKTCWAPCSVSACRAPSSSGSCGTGLSRDFEGWILCPFFSTLVLFKNRIRFPWALMVS